MGTQNEILTGENRDRNRVALLHTLWQDICYSYRMYRKSPTFTLVSVAMLALGIGANIAMYSLTYQILLRDLPVKQPKRLVILNATGPNPGFSLTQGDPAATFSYSTYKELRKQTQVFSGLLARYATPVSVTGQGFSERANGELVSGNYFDVLGVQPALGRVLASQDEGAAGANPLAVLSYSYWSRRYGNSRDVVNKQITVNGVALTIVGIAQQGFTGVQIGQVTDIFIPVTMQAQIMLFPGLDDPSDYFLALIGRLKPDVSSATAQSALQVAYRPILDSQASRLKISQKTLNRFLTKKMFLTPGSHGRPILQRDAAKPLLLVTVVAFSILLLACANLAGLLIAKGEERHQEIAVRQSLGASQGRLIRQLLTESLLLAFAGGAAGLLLAQWTLWVLGGSITRKIAGQSFQTVSSGPILGYCFGLSFFTAILFGFIPALRLVRSDPQASLRNQNVKLSSGLARVRIRKSLLVFQVAITAVLLTAAGAFAQSLFNLRHTDLGLQLNELTEFSIAPGLSGYSPSQAALLFDRLREGIKALPGVTSVSIAEIPLFSAENDNTSRITAEGYAAQPDENTTVSENWIGPGYFKTVGISLLSGREFSPADTPTSVQVGIINEKLMKRFFAERDPIGRHFSLSIPGLPQNIQIVGVVKDSRNFDVRQEAVPFVYLPYTQDVSLFQATLYVRSVPKPGTIVPELRRMVSTVDPKLPVYDLRAVAETVDQSLFAHRMLTYISVSFGVLAALLVSVGLYGLIAYIVARRTKELGIRIALGADKKMITWLILQDQAFITVVGLTLGLTVTAIMARLVQSLLFGVKANSPAILISTTAAIALLSIIAGMLPARRATNLNLVDALRTD